MSRTSLDGIDMVHVKFSDTKSYRNGHHIIAILYLVVSFLVFDNTICIFLGIIFNL